MDLEHKAIMRLQEAARLSEFYYHDALLVSYSGGKDSDVVLELCRRAGIPFSVIHNLTTADAPETFYHIRKVFHRLELDNVPCAINKPTYKGQSISMWTLIPQKMIPPSRSIRYCCSIMKERNGTNRCVVLGVRKYESAGRADSAVAEIQGKTRNGKATFDFDNGDERIIAPCQMKATIRIHPIVDWTDRDIWQFLRDTKVDMNPCYAMGFKRVGCVGCPIAGKNRYEEFRQWSKFENLYRKAFGRMVEARRAIGKDGPWRDADAVFRWWMEDKNLDGQLDIFGGEVGAYEP